MSNHELMRKLSKLGLPMFEPNEAMDVNETLAEVVKSNDTRLWEGFPVLLVNAAENYQFSPDMVEKFLKNNEDKRNYHQLFALSAAVYSYYHLTFPWLNKQKNKFSDEEKTLVKTWRDLLAHNQDLILENGKLDSERLKKLFELYFEQNVEKTRRSKERYEEFSLAYALSQVFSPKQTELFKKKLEGLPLTKTDQEYYSRTVRKKVVALANSELHGLAKKILEQ